MSEDRVPPDDPLEWLNRAKSNLTQAQTRVPGVYLYSGLAEPIAEDEYVEALALAERLMEWAETIGKRARNKNEAR